MKNSVYKGFIVVVLVLFQLGGNSQESKWMIYFKDKPDIQFDPYEYFDEKAIERRLKHNLPLYTKSDLPVDQQYVEEVSAIASSVKGVTRWLNGIVVYSSVSEINQIEQLPFVIRVEEMYSGKEILSNDEKHALQITPQQLRSDQLERMGLNVFEQKNIDGSGVRVAIFDAGFPYVDQHDAFSHLRESGRIIKGYDFVSKSDKIYKANNHGSKCLSNICGIYEGKKIGLGTGIEVLLARTEKAKLEPLSEEENWLFAAEWADKNGADLISSSLGYTYKRYHKSEMDGHTSVVAKAARMATRKGMLVVNAAGNSGDENWKFIGTPADVDSVLTIGGIRPESDYHINFSSYGPTANFDYKPNVVAFGMAAVAANNNKLSIAAGTSFATPLVAGFAACAMQLYPDATNMEIFKMIERSAHLYPYFDYAHGFGVPQAANLIGDKTPVSPTFEVNDNGQELVVKVFELPEEVEYKSDGYLYFHFQDDQGVIKTYTVVQVNDEIPISFLKEDIVKYKSLKIHYQGFTLTKDLN